MRLIKIHRRRNIEYVFGSIGVRASAVLKPESNTWLHYKRFLYRSDLQKQDTFHVKNDAAVRQPIFAFNECLDKGKINIKDRYL